MTVVKPADVEERVTVRHTSETHPLIVQQVAELDPWLRSAQLGATELSINKPRRLAIESVGRGYHEVEVPWLTLEWCEQLCLRLANVSNRKFAKRKPMLAATLPGGHRFQALMGANVLSGVSISIRVKRRVPRSFADFNVTPAQAEILVDAVQRGLNILVSGGTNTGKTSFLQLLCEHIPEGERVISVEDVDELRPTVWNWVQLIVNRADSGTDITFGDIIDVLNRSNPYRVINGELSVENAYPSARFLNLGSRGFMGSIHASTALGALGAWRFNVDFSPHGRSTNGDAVVRGLVDRLDLIVQIERTGVDRREVTAIVDPKDLPWEQLIADGAGAAAGGGAAPALPGLLTPLAAAQDPDLLAEFAGALEQLAMVCTRAAERGFDRQAEALQLGRLGRRAIDQLGRGGNQKPVAAGAGAGRAKPVTN